MDSRGIWIPGDSSGDSSRDSTFKLRALSNYSTGIKKGCQRKAASVVVPSFGHPIISPGQ